jgi:hypothetical protein
VLKSARLLIASSTIVISSFGLGGCETIPKAPAEQIESARAALRLCLTTAALKLDDRISSADVIGRQSANQCRSEQAEVVRLASQGQNEGYQIGVARGVPRHAADYATTVALEHRAGTLSEGGAPGH